MAKTRGPLLSFGASGQISKTQVFSRWKGRAYARSYVVPSNPKTADQHLTRDLFGWLQAVYKTAPVRVSDAWDAAASGQVMTGRNMFGKVNVPLLRGTLAIPITVATTIVLSPGARAGFAADSITVTPGNDLLTVDLAKPSLPVGWTIDKAVVAAVRQQDPHSGLLHAIASGEDVTDPYQVVLTGLANAQTYVVCGWFVYTRPDLKKAYGRSISATGLTT